MSTTSVSFEIPIYEITCHVGRDADVVTVDGEQHGEPPDLTNSAGWSRGNCDNGKVFIAVLPHADPIRAFGTVAHECLHIVNGIMGHVGQFPYRKNDEADAYLLTYLVENTLRALEEYDRLKAEEGSNGK